MLLKNYLKKYGISQVGFAKMCGVTVGTINNISCNRKLTNAPLALRIEDMTGGEVKAISVTSKENKKRLKIAQKYNPKEGER